VESASFVNERSQWEVGTCEAELLVLSENGVTRKSQSSCAVVSSELSFSDYTNFSQSSLHIHPTSNPMHLLRGWD
jgi:hypothetical protein